MIIIYICIFFFGASLASFLNATIYRQENNYKQKEFFTKPSHCEKCKKPLTWYELIPVIGYIIQLGKCSKCKTLINIYYPLSELILGIATLLFYIYPIPWYHIVIFFFLFVLSNYDQREHAIPKKLTDILFVVCILLHLIFIRNYANLLLPFGVALFFVVLNMVKKAFGKGDILVLLGLGILLGYQQYIVMFWTSILVALFYSLIYIFLKKKKIHNTYVPMIPSISVAYVIALVWGEKIFAYILENIIL